MKFRSVLSEAGRDLATGTARALLFALTLGVIITLLGVVDAATVADARSAEEQFRSSGGAVQVIEANGYVDGRRCEALTAIEEVSAAGAFRRAGQVTALALPSTRLTLYEVTPGLFSVIREIAPVAADSQDHGPGVWMTRDLADTLGVAPGGTVATSAGKMFVSGVFAWPDDGRDRALGFSVLAPISPSALTASTGGVCYASTWPPDSDLAPLFVFATDATPRNPPSIAQLNSSNGTTFSIAALLESRTTRWTLPASLLAGLAIGFISTRLRRLEIASALHAQIDRTSLTWIHLLQTAAWSLAALLCATAVITWFAVSSGLTYWADVWRTGIRVVLAGAIGTPLGTILAVSTIREKLLFRYFKDR